MKVLFLLGLVASVYSLGYHEDIGIPEYARLRNGEAVSSRIIGGFPTKSTQHTYAVGVLVTLRTGQLSVCGGTILSQHRILTAAQCWYDGYNQGKKMIIRYGSPRLFGGNSRDVIGVDIHPNFDPLIPIHDIAVLSVNYNMYFGDYAQPVMLPTKNDVNKTFTGVGAHIVGYGKTGDWSPIGPAQVRQSVSVPVVSIWNCYETFGYYDPEKQMCTQGNAWGACTGDVGGPLVIKNYFNGTDLLIGVTSLVSPVGCDNGFPNGYTRVTYYLDWILSQL
ncbi:collagenase-like [Trichoplusia ni]|uniref:Collagenase-like n=1 Tax=Trichoplusia ni TaxID=7111 RepID=A0A7E5X5F2_TRINI|nr:collagenase-like [Trichoplusia ni]